MEVCTYYFSKGRRVRPPKQSCGDSDRWQRVINSILQELGDKTPQELAVLLDPDSGTHTDELDKIRRQSLFAMYMSSRLGIEFKYSTPSDRYPMFYVQIVIGVHKSNVRLEVRLPRSVATYIRHEGALRENSSLKFEFSTPESRQFAAQCIIRGLDPQQEWARIKSFILGPGISPQDISEHGSKLHYEGLYPDELTTTEG